MSQRDPAEDQTDRVTPFRALVRAFVQGRDVNRTELAREFEVAQTTVDRWWLGTATPHPRIQAQVIEWIHARQRV